MWALTDHRQKQLDAQAKSEAMAMAFKEKERQDELKRYRTELARKNAMAPDYSAGGTQAVNSGVKWQSSPSGTRYYRDANGKIHIA
jgi:hypothetical protein